MPYGEVRLIYTADKEKFIGNPTDIYLCTFESKRASRTEIIVALVFDPVNRRFRVRVSQDYETQAKIEFTYSEADAYFATHLEHLVMAKGAISDHVAKNLEHSKGMAEAMARMKVI